MTRPAAAPRSRQPLSDEIDDDIDNPPPADDFDAADTDLAGELEDQTGIDLSDASDLDADNVPADEENDRVMQAPD
jgi:hypothetical protein